MLFAFLLLFGKDYEPPEYLDICVKAKAVQVTYEDGRKPTVAIVCTEYERWVNPAWLKWRERNPVEREV